MIIVKSPYRVSLLGGSTDYNNYLQKNGNGLAIGFSIDKYSYVTVQPLRNHSRIIYSKVENVSDFSHIEHIGIKAAILYNDFVGKHLEVTHISDIEANAGLGTSSAMMVALVQALSMLKGRELEKIDLIKTAVVVEQSYSTVGWQDAALSVFGGLSTVGFKWSNCYKNVLLSKLPTPRNFWHKIEKYGLLFDTGEKRNASSVVDNYVNELPDNPLVKQIYDFAEKGADLLSNDEFDIYEFGELVYDSWLLKKKISPKITTPKVQKLEDICIDDCFSFKLLGAGGGGSIFCMADPIYHNIIVEKVQKEGCVQIPFKISGGTEILSR